MWGGPHRCHGRQVKWSKKRWEWRFSSAELTLPGWIRLLESLTLGSLLPVYLNTIACGKISRQQSHPFCKLPVCTINSVLCLIKAFQSHEVLYPLLIVDFSAYTISVLSVQEVVSCGIHPRLFPTFSSIGLSVTGLYVEVFDPLELEFCTGW